MFDDWLMVQKVIEAEKVCYLNAIGIERAGEQTHLSGVGHPPSLQRLRTI